MAPKSRAMMALFMVLSMTLLVESPTSTPCARMSLNAWMNWFEAFSPLNWYFRMYRTRAR